MSRVRSPNYHQLSLLAAIDRVARVLPRNTAPGLQPAYKVNPRCEFQQANQEVAGALRLEMALFQWALEIQT